MRQAYPSDITREQFEKIREELEGAKKNTHPRKYDLQAVRILSGRPWQKAGENSEKKVEEYEIWLFFCSYFDDSGGGGFVRAAAGEHYHRKPCSRQIQKWLILHGKQM